MILRFKIFFSDELWLIICVEWECDADAVCVCVCVMLCNESKYSNTIVNVDTHDESECDN